MPKLVRNEETGITYLFIGFHEWAWSLRTSGFPIYALRSNGEATKIGLTSKKPAYYIIPDDTIAIIRTYSTNSNYRIYYVYQVPDMKEFVVDERNNFELPTELKPEIAEKLRRVIQLWTTL